MNFRKGVTEFLFSIIVLGCLLMMLLWNTGCGICKKQPEPEIKYVTVTDTVVKDTTIILPADTYALFVAWSELCDTTIIRDTVYVAKAGRKSALVKRDSTGFRFLCMEDSLKVVIKDLETRIKNVQPISVVKNNKPDWLPMHYILLLFSAGLCLLAISRLISGK